MKWRNFVPAEFADEIFPKPHDDILKKRFRRRGVKKIRRGMRKES
jgi:hypothetical protein